MLYPNKIKIREKSKIQIVKCKLYALKNGIKKKIKYLVFDRTNLGEIIFVKFHI